jgi:hypothetical protein
MHNAADDRLQNGASRHQGTDETGNDATDPDQAGSGGDGADDGTTEEGHGGGAASSLPGAIAATAAMLRLAEGVVAAGRKVDLTGLEDRIGLVCARALDLPPDEGARLRPDLVALLRDLDALAVALRQ